MTQLKKRSMDRIAKHLTMLNADIDDGVLSCKCGTCETHGSVAKRVIGIMHTTAMEVMEDKATYDTSIYNLSIVAHGVDTLMSVMMEPVLAEIVDRAKSPDLDGEDRVSSFQQLQRLSQYLRSQANEIDDFARALIPDEISKRASDVSEAIKKALRESGVRTDGVSFEIGRLSLEGKKKAPRKKRPPEG